jgi:hypothetical protein
MEDCGDPRSGIILRREKKTMGAIGTGIYTPREVARLAHIHPSRLTRWTAGYTFQSGGRPHQSPPIVSRERDHGPSLTFLDLIEVLFVKSFLDHGVKMRTIREAASKARELFGKHHPFAIRKFETDGRAIFAVLAKLDKSAEILLNVVDGQTSFASIISMYLKQIDYDPVGEASRWWPLGKDEPIFIDPRFSFGTPLTKTGHVPTNAIHLALKAGDSADDIARWFDIPLGEVRAAEMFQQRMAA